MLICIPEEYPNATPRVLFPEIHYKALRANPASQVNINRADISLLPLRALQSRMSIIPQSPVLFKGTLRAYIDPFDEFTDTDIWSAFDKVDMKAKIDALENQLSFELSENGENFSVGERQMLCMARALLNRSRIVVMDETTASID